MYGIYIDDDSKEFYKANLVASYMASRWQNYLSGAFPHTLLLQVLRNGFHAVLFLLHTLDHLLQLFVCQFSLHEILYGIQIIIK